MTSEFHQIEEAAAFLTKRCGRLPKFAMVLGSGLNPVADKVQVETEVPYSEIPHCPRSNVSGHAARLIVGKLDGHRVVVLQGRMHFYEGHSLPKVVFLSRAVARAGSGLFLLTNAAGGLHKGVAPGDLMMITDHLNLMGANPLVGPNIQELGTRFPDLVDLYSASARECFQLASKETGVALKSGIYVALNGPSYETPAEVRMYRMLGGDAVGMSTAPEAIALRHMGAKVVGMSCISNLAAGVSDTPANHEEVLETGAAVSGAVSKLLKSALKHLEQRHEI